MSEAVVVAIVTGAFASLVSLVSVILSSRLTIYRIEQLEQKMEKHNNIVERVAIAETSIKSAHKRIDIIEHKPPRA